MKKAKISYFSTILLVIANIIGTGIFTTTGYLYLDLQNISATFYIWIIGGVLALTGALTYASISINYPRSGGEYHLLTKLFHPSLGFVSGFVSLIAGFSAPIAASSIAFGKYFGAVLPLFSPIQYAVGLVLFLTVVHSIGIKYGASLQNVFTLLKISLIVLFILIGFNSLPSFSAGWEKINSDFSWAAMLSPAFAVGLVYVSFSYSGWNAAIYIIDEVKNPRKNLPIALIGGTLVVIVLYLGLNFIFLATTNPETFAGKEEVGHIVALNLLQERGANFLSMLISVALISSVSAMTMAGPRVTYVMGQDFKIFKVLARKSRNNTPVVALILQFIVVTIMILTAKFDVILKYIGFTLSIFTFLVALGGTIKHMKKELKLWGFPFVPVIFMALNIWMIVYTGLQTPIVLLTGFLTLFVGFIIYWIINKFSNEQK